MVPGELKPWLDDRRRLGVMVSRLAVRADHEVLAIPLDHPALSDGWWAAEWHGPLTLRRWTDGDALLKLPGHLTGPKLLEVTLGGSLDYPVSDADRHLSRRAA
jgi:hypothetical protein